MKQTEDCAKTQSPNLKQGHTLMRAALQIRDGLPIYQN